MSKKWKITIGAVIAAVVVAGVALAVWGVVTFGHRVYEHGWEPGVHKWGPEATTQLEVRLLDDNEDGIPDRGVIEVLTGLPSGRGFGPSRDSRFGPGHGLYFGRGFSPHFGRGFGPLLIVGGLFRLAFLALLIGLAVAFFRHRLWGPPSSAKGQEM
jgi:hypothetical protein